MLYGYAGLFDAIKTKEDELNTVYQYDLICWNMLLLFPAIDNVEASIGTEGSPASIRHFISTSQEVVDAFNKRSDAMKGIAPT